MLWCVCSDPLNPILTTRYNTLRLIKSDMIFMVRSYHIESAHSTLLWSHHFYFICSYALFPYMISPIQPSISLCLYISTLILITYNYTRLVPYFGGQFCTIFGQTENEFLLRSLYPCSAVRFRYG